MGKSKTIVTKDYLNLGAARIIADYQTLMQTANIATLMHCCFKQCCLG